MDNISTPLFLQLSYIDESNNLRPAINTAISKIIKDPAPLKLLVKPCQPLNEKDWDLLIELMNQHRITGLDAAGQMTDRLLERLSYLDFIQYLRLNDSVQLTDLGLKHLQRMPHLLELEMGGAKMGITDNALQVLQQLTMLNKFSIPWLAGITDNGMTNLRFCDRLETVNLIGTHTGDGAVNALAGKSKLNNFKTGRLVTNGGLALFSDFPVFKTWNGGENNYELMSAEVQPNHLMIDGSFTNEGFKDISGLHGLFGFSVFWHSPTITPSALALIKDLPHLGFLGFGGNLCDDEAMHHISTMPHLRKLMAQGSVAGDAGFKSLSRSQTLEFIWGRECPNLTGTGFVALGGMPALKGLAVSCKNINDEALSQLPQFSTLKEFMPMDLSDEGFRHLASCENLEKLWCMYCRNTTDIATSHISRLPKLNTYYAGMTQITDLSLELISGMNSLESVELYKCLNITNTGLSNLKNLPTLKTLRIGGLPKVTPASLVSFPPQVRIDYWN